MNRTKIEYATHVFNPVVGCTGSCPYCYARQMAQRFHRDFTPHWVESAFRKSMPREPGARIFVNSVSDVADWRHEWISAVVGKVYDHPEHLWLFLTKRPWEVYGKWIPTYHAMLGFTATCQQDIENLAHRPGRRDIDWFSFEPLLGPIDLKSNTRQPYWIVVGALTGPGAKRRAPKVGWLFDIRSYCDRYRIPLFEKSSLKDTIWPLRQEYPVEAVR